MARHAEMQELLDKRAGVLDKRAGVLARTAAPGAPARLPILAVSPVLAGRADVSRPGHGHRGLAPLPGLPGGRTGERAAAQVIPVTALPAVTRIWWRCKDYLVRGAAPGG